MAAEILDQRQTELDAPASTHIGIQVVVAPTTGQPLMGSPLRAAAAVGALAGLASLAAVYGFESLMTQRRRRRTERARAAEQDDEVGPTEGDTREGSTLDPAELCPPRLRDPLGGREPPGQRRLDPDLGRWRCRRARGPHRR